MSAVDRASRVTPEIRRNGRAPTTPTQIEANRDRSYRVNQLAGSRNSLNP